MNHEKRRNNQNIKEWEKLKVLFQILPMRTNGLLPYISLSDSIDRHCIIIFLPQAQGCKLKVETQYS